MELTQNPSVLELVRKTAELTTPKEIVWIDGSEAQLDSLRKIAVETGELIKLNEEKLPGCYLNRSDVNDVARVEGRTFICSRTREEAGPTNNWMDPDEMKAKLHEILRCAMAGRTMYVIPYSMGVIGSPFAKYGIEITDSIYVVLNMAIMTRIGTKVLEALGDSSDVILGVHSKAKLDPENRYIVHFPEENKIVSVNSNYGGNVLQGKKCFSLRIASELGRREGWLAEHMLILGIENPQGEVRYVTGAFPSACGKTNLAMLIPPEGYRKKGWKCWTVGDDIAWLRVGPDGRLWAVNPENGFFGVAPGTSERSNPNGRYDRLVGGHDQAAAQGPPAQLEGRSVGRQRRYARCASEQPLHRPGGKLPVHQRGVFQGHRRADQRDHFRRPPREDRAAGLPVPRLGARRCAPRPDGHASVLRLQHGRLLAALARHGQEAAECAEDLQCQLVPHR